MAWRCVVANKVLWASKVLTPARSVNLALRTSWMRWAMASSKRNCTSCFVGCTLTSTVVGSMSSAM